MLGAIIAGGIAAASALLATLGAGAAAPALPVTTMVVQADPSPVAVIHVTKIVTLAPGVTAPPNVVVQQLPAPSPQPRTVIVRTTQSGHVVP